MKFEYLIWALQITDNIASAKFLIFFLHNQLQFLFWSLHNCQKKSEMCQSIIGTKKYKYTSNCCIHNSVTACMISYLHICTRTHDLQTVVPWGMDFKNFNWKKCLTIDMELNKCWNWILDSDVRWNQGMDFMIDFREILSNTFMISELDL